jgi:ribosome-associated translation inhibitor RaiA
MQIIIRHGSENIAEKTLELVHKKVSKLARVVDERNSEAHVHVDISRESGSQHSDSMWRASINIENAGDRFNASEVAQTPEKAVDQSVCEVKRSIRSARARQRALVKRGGGMFKMLNQRFF